eukprot:1582527-Pleurochrysis_carterae.AAC.2
MNRERQKAVAARRSSGGGCSGEVGDGDGVDGVDGGDAKSVNGDVDNGFDADVPMSGKNVILHQPTNTQARLPTIQIFSSGTMPLRLSTPIRAIAAAGRIGLWGKIWQGSYVTNQYSTKSLGMLGNWA